MTHEEYESKSQMKRVEILKAEEKQMTHEELLEKMAQIAHTKDANEARNDYLLSLRAVVELHKVLLVKNYENNTDWYECQACGKEYPCPTIQTIEKELR